MTTRNVLLTLHILFAMVTLGWLASQAMLAPRAMRAGHLEVVRFSGRAASILGPASLLVFALGVALVLRQKDDYAEFEHTWVNASMSLFILMLVNGAVVMARQERRALKKLEAGQSAAGEAKWVSLLGAVNMLMLVVVVFLMVAKPGQS